MNIPLDTFELHFDETVLLAGERIYDEGGVEDVNQIDKNLWIAEIKDNSGTHEVELVLTRKNLKKSTCECMTYLDHGACGHIVASLFSIRKKRIKAKTPARSAKRKKSSASVSLPSVLNSLTKEELLDYLKTIARRKKEIANDLKLKYAYRLPHYPAKNKYQDILYSIFKPHIKRGSISINQAKALFIMLADLMDQATDFAALQQYEDSIYAALAAIQKINYLYRKIPEDKQSQFDDLLLETYDNLKFILSQDIAPKLRMEAIMQIEELATSNYYQWKNVNSNFILLLWDEVWSVEQRLEFVNETLPELLDEFEEADETKYLALAFYLIIRAGLDNTYLWNKLGTVDTPQFRRICRTLYPENAQIVYQLCGIALQKNKDWRLQKYCFDLLAKEDNNEEILTSNKSVIHNLLALTGDLKIAEWLIQHDPDLMDSIEAVIELVRRRQPPFKADRICVYLYFHLNMEEDLIQLIVDNLRVDYFNLFAPKLLKEDPEKANKLFLNISEKYLDNHLGSKAHEKINAVLTYLENQNALETKVLIEELIKGKYAHRTGLTEQVS